jgi:hypothetical protein
MPGKPKDQWEVNQRFKEGDRSMLVEPLDYRIMELLPKEGTLAGGLYPIGESVPGIVKKLGGGPLTVSMVSSRVRILNVLGLAVKKKGVGGVGNFVWQITKSGEEEVASWKQAQDS